MTATRGGEPLSILLVEDDDGDARAVKAATAASRATCGIAAMPGAVAWAAERGRRSERRQAGPRRGRIESVAVVQARR